MKMFYHEEVDFCFSVFSTNEMSFSSIVESEAPEEDIPKP